MGLWPVLAERELGNDTTAMGIASLLAEKIHAERSVHFFEETDQDIERVLDIFIRVNSGGTVLSYSEDRKSTRLNSSHVAISYAVFCLKKKKPETSERPLVRRTHNPQSP